MDASNFVERTVRISQFIDADMVAFAERNGLTYDSAVNFHLRAGTVLHRAAKEWYDFKRKQYEQRLDDVADELERINRAYQHEFERLGETVPVAMSNIALSNVEMAEIETALEGKLPESFIKSCRWPDDVPKPWSDHTDQE